MAKRKPEARWPKQVPIWIEESAKLLPPHVRGHVRAQLTGLAAQIHADHSYFEGFSKRALVEELERLHALASFQDTLNRALVFHLEEVVAQMNKFRMEFEATIESHHARQYGWRYAIEEQVQGAKKKR